MVFRVHRFISTTAAALTSAGEVPRRSYVEAVTLMIVGFSLVPGMDAIAKYSGTELQVAQIASLRISDDMH